MCKYSFKEMTHDMSEVSRRYFACKRELKKLSVDEKKDKRAITLLEVYIDRVKDCYCMLSEKERNMINNEFFFVSYPTWWVRRYSKATYYRIKKNAMQKFLEVFYENGKYGEGDDVNSYVINRGTN